MREPREEFPAEAFIRAKRAGRTHRDAELAAFVQAFTAGSLPDYQAAAWLMAVYFQGLTFAETLAYTRALVASGERLHTARLPGRPVDKHSTGGVGDKTTLVLVPLVAAAGQPVVKLSGRGLGHTGGTVDKLESIPGFRAGLDRDAIARQVEAVGCVIASQSLELVPADARFYALRDVTGTVESLPLIAASIMSKKVATGSAGVVLDVKVGRGALLSRLSEAAALARLMVELGRALGLRASAVISDMEAPLGRAVGNALEVREAAAVLRGEGPADVRALCLELGARMLVLGGTAAGLAEARERLERVLAGGQAWERLLQLVERQGGDAAAVAGDRLPRAPVLHRVHALSAGWVTGVDARAVGRAAAALGAGRRRKEEAVDPAVGIELWVRRGETVVPGSPVAEIHARTEAAAVLAAGRLRRAVTVGEEPPPARPLVHRVLE